MLSKTNINHVKNVRWVFMVPGMGHCGGGDGTSTFDMLSALDVWVEGGEAPDHIPASRVKDGVSDRTTAALSLSAGRYLQGQRQHRRGGEFCLQGP